MLGLPTIPLTIKPKITLRIKKKNIYKMLQENVVYILTTLTYLM